MDIDRSVRSSDTFDMIVSYRRAETGERQAGNLLYAGVDRGGKSKTQLMRWGDNGKFYEASGVGETRTGLVRPVPGAISSSYGMRRHPILGYKRMHSGQDYRGGYGTPIRAVTDGRVAFAGRKGGYGNFVRLNHAGGLGTGYAHMSRIAVAAGASVRRGQVIGYVGSTGLSTGPHLHYEMYRGNQKINPASVSYVTRAEISGEELRRFRSRLGVSEDSRGRRSPDRHQAQRSAGSRSPPRDRQAGRLLRAAALTSSPDRAIADFTNFMPRDDAMTASYPASRLRRTRATAWSRALHRETVMTSADLIWPLFIIEGKGAEEPVASLPGVSRWSIDGIVAPGKGGCRPRHSGDRPVPEYPRREAHRRRRGSL